MTFQGRIDNNQGESIIIDDIDKYLALNQKVNEILFMIYSQSLIELQKYSEY